METGAGVARRVSSGKSMVTLSSPRGLKEAVSKPFFVSKELLSSAPTGNDIRQDLVHGNFSARGTMSVFHSDYSKDAGQLSCQCDVTRFTLTITLDAAATSDNIVEQEFYAGKIACFYSEVVCAELTQLICDAILQGDIAGVAKHLKHPFSYIAANLSNNQGLSPLILAATCKNACAMSVLLHHKSVIVNQHDELGNTAMHVAAKNGCRSCFALLLVRGGDYTKMNKAGCTPADLAQAKELAPLLQNIMGGEEGLNKLRAIVASIVDELPVNAVPRDRSMCLIAARKNPQAHVLNDAIGTACFSNHLKQHSMELHHILDLFVRIRDFQSTRVGGSLFLEEHSSSIGSGSATASASATSSAQGSRETGILLRTEAEYGAVASDIACVLEDDGHHLPSFRAQLPAGSMSALKNRVKGGDFTPDMFDSYVPILQPFVEKAIETYWETYITSSDFDSYVNQTYLSWKTRVAQADKELTFKLSVAFDISRIDIIPLPDYSIDIRSIDLRFMQFTLSEADYSSFLPLVMEKVRFLATNSRMSYFNARLTGPNNTVVSQKKECYKFDLHASCTRLGVNLNDFQSSPWATHAFKLHSLVLLGTLTKEEIDLLLQFHFQSGLPVLSWSSPETGVLLRCQRPRMCVGTTSLQCIPEEYKIQISCSLNLFDSLNIEINSADNLPILVVDTGSPNEDLKGMHRTRELMFLDISSSDIFLYYEQIYSINQEYCAKERQILDFYQKVETSSWREMLTKICKVTASIQEKLLKNQVVVIQSGGPDHRCVDSIISCLLLLSMDPYYRTIAGFCELLRKEWFLEGVLPWCSPPSDAQMTNPIVGLYFNPKLVSAFNDFKFSATHEYPVPPERARFISFPFFLLFIGCVFEMRINAERAFEWQDAFLSELVCGYHQACSEPMHETRFTGKTFQDLFALVTQQLAQGQVTHEPSCPFGSQVSDANAPAFELSDVEWSRKHREYTATVNDFFLELSLKIAKHPAIFLSREKSKPETELDKSLEEVPVKPYLDLKSFHFDVRRARCEHTPLLISHQLLHLIDFVHKKKTDENRIEVSYVLSRFPEEILPHFHQLEHLSLSANLSSLPGSFGQLFLLKSLNLSRNYFVTFPEVILELVHLTKLDLSENRIDALPSAILSLTALSKLSISNNLLKNLDFLGGHDMFLDSHLLAEVPRAGSRSQIRQAQQQQQQQQAADTHGNKQQSTQQAQISPRARVSPRSVIAFHSTSSDRNSSNSSNSSNTTQSSSTIAGSTDSLSLIVSSGSSSSIGGATSREIAADKRGELSTTESCTTTGEESKDVRLHRVQVQDMSSSDTAMPALLPMPLAETGVAANALGVSGGEAFEARRQLYNRKRSSFLKHVAEVNKTRPRAMTKGANKLLRLDVSHNRISELPTHVHLLLALDKLSLNNNPLTHIPYRFTAIARTRMNYLDLSNTGLHALPTDWSYFTRLVTLNLSHNRLSDLPVSLFTCVNLRHLYLGTNRLASLPPAMKALSNLEILDLSHNDLKLIPFWISKMTRMKRLFLGNNKIVLVSPAISAMEHLHTLDLSENNLTILPSTLVFMKSLEKVKISGNKLPKQFDSAVTVRDVNHCIANIKKDEEKAEPAKFYSTSVMFLGPANSGKEVISHRVFDSKYFKPLATLPEFDSEDLQTNYYTFRDSRKESAKQSRELDVRVSAWSCRDAQMMDNVFPLYCRPNSTIVLVLDLSRSRQILVNQIHYWCLNITLSIRIKSPRIVFVFNLCEKWRKLNNYEQSVSKSVYADVCNTIMEDCAKAQAFRQIDERDYCYVDSETGYGMDGLKAKLVDLVASSPYTISMKPKYLHLLHRLQEIEREKLKAKKFPFITHEEFAFISNTFGIEKAHEIEEVREKFHQNLLVIAHYRGRMDGIIILNPKWLAHLLFSFLTIPFNTRNNVSNGIFTVTKMHSILSNFAEPRLLILILLERFGFVTSHRLKLNSNFSSEMRQFFFVRGAFTETYQKNKKASVATTHANSITLQRIFKLNFFSTTLFSMIMGKTLELNEVDVAQEAIVAWNDSDQSSSGLEIAFKKSTLSMTRKSHVHDASQKDSKKSAENLTFQLRLSVIGDPEEAIPIFSTLCVAFYDCMLQTRVDFHSYYVMKSKELVDIDEFNPFLEDATFQIEFRGEALDLSHILPEKFMTSFVGQRFAMKQFELKKTIGKGGYAEVFLGSHKLTKEQYAIKELIDPEESKYEAMANANLKGKLQFRTFHQMGKEFKHEIGIQGALAHPNILQIKGIIIKPFCIVTEYCAYGDLFNYAMNWKKSFGYDRKIKFTRDIACGIQYLQNLDPPIAHIDLKTPNVFLYSVDPKDAVCAKIADFGTSQRISEPLEVRLVDNPIYLAPEILKGLPYDQRVDIYAFGAAVWEIVTRKNFLCGIHDFDITEMILLGERPDIPAGFCVPEFETIITRCWAQNPENRPKMEEVLQILDSITPSAAQRYDELYKHYDEELCAQYKDETALPPKTTTKNNVKKFAMKKMQSVDLKRRGNEEPSNDTLPMKVAPNLATSLPEVKNRRSTSTSAQYLNIGGIFSDGGLIGKRHKSKDADAKGKDEKAPKEDVREAKDRRDDEVRSLENDLLSVVNDSKKKRRSLSGNMFDMGKLSKSDSEKEKKDKGGVQFNIT